MLKTIRNVGPGALLIVLAASVLLYADRDRRRPSSPAAAAKPAAKALPRLAVMQWNSTDLLDFTVAGIVEGLRRQGFEHGRTAEIRFFNASGDNATGNALARDLAGGRYDMVLTASTLALQAVAQANKEGRVLHVFGGVTDPYGAGVGITGPRPDQHPRHLVGVGTFQPVERAIRLARLMYPALRRIGVVWNPGESNSEACVGKARAVCRELGVQLVEANAGSTSEVPEAIRSLMARGVEAVWVGGDTVAISSLSAIVSAARASGIPVFTNDPNDASHGALFGVGASYRQVGVAVGEIGGRILNGEDPRSFGVENLVPEVLSVNEAAFADLGKGWSLPDDVRAQARAGATPAAAVPSPAPAAGPAAARSPQPGRTYKVGILYFSSHSVFDTAIAGIRASLRQAGFVEGRNLEVRLANPNGDMSLLPQAARQLADSGCDALVPLSTPCLQAIVASPRRSPVVFGAVSSPVEAGAGKSYGDHLPDVTGAVWTAPNPGLFRGLKALFPECRTVGLVYNPSDANSMREKETARAMLAEQGMRLVERTINSSSEISEAIQSLLAARVDAVFGMGDNTVASGFAGLAGACRKARVPLLGDDNSLMGSGAVFSCGASPAIEGRRTGRMVAGVLLGDRPAGIPFSPSDRAETAVDFEAAANLGLALPAAVLRACDLFHHPSARVGRPFRVALVGGASNPLLETAAKGFVRGLAEAGFREKTDFTLAQHNAGGDAARLPAVLAAARAGAPDLIVTFTTPAMIEAVRGTNAVPVVFAVASDPVALGLFTPETRPAHVTGVHDDPPVDRLLDMARRHDPALAAVGIVYDPSQPNSLISVKKLRAACGSRGVALHEAPAPAVTGLTAAVESVVRQGARAILLSADNLVATGFPAIRDAAKAAGVPVYATEAELAAQGAAGAVGDNYEAWGAQAALLAARVLAGVRPADLPVEKTLVQEVIEPGDAAPAPAAAKPAAAATPARPWEIRIVRYNDAQFSADTFRGMMEGFGRLGLKEGRDFNARCLNAQGDMTTLTSIMTAIRSEHPDLVMTISTPALQAALRQLSDLRIVFGCVADAVHAGAGTSETNHLPNVTGIYTRSPMDEMARLIARSIPKVRAVGTLYSPGEVNAEFNRQWFAEALAKEHLKLVAVPINSTAEASEAVGALLRSDIQAVVQTMDNNARPAYAQIARRAGEAGLAFLCFDSSGLREGAALSYGRDYYASGVEAAEVAVRVLRGADPKDIPFAITRTEALVINPALARAHGIVLPPELEKQAQVFENPKP